ncbi:hypothetical protein KFK09_016383 [Dendrobium nobile]|uniref:Uncharacterized protein n=1 Tax=Dendrobium nobile TaxID=94219 RepID=A0A8T3AZS8_DENNO|nr:hypothetical protein KFK09_016383 [Dendrobium nobile]
MSMLEQRKDVSPLAQDFDGIHPRDDQISSIYTTPSIELGFEEFEDTLPNSSFLPLYDEPVYDVYDDDMLGDVLDLDQPVYDNDGSKVDVLLELVIHISPDKVTNTLTIINNKIGMTKPDHDIHLGTVTDSDTKFLEAVSVDTNMCIVDPFYVQFNSTCEECCLEELLKMPKEFDSYPIFHRLQVMWKSLQDGANDTGWKYPNRFSQPNPPPSCGQPDIFLWA